MNKIYNLIDQQLLSLLMTWDQIHDDLMDAALHLPDDWMELKESGKSTPAMIRYDADSEMLKGIELAARKLISSAEDAHLISLDDWRVMNGIICIIGLDDPDTAAATWWRPEAQLDCCNPSFLEVCDDL